LVRLLSRAGYAGKILSGFTFTEGTPFTGDTLACDFSLKTHDQLAAKPIQEKAQRNPAGHSLNQNCSQHV
jgi:hypothetical protein